MAVNKALKHSAQKFETWMADQCLPLWVAQGFNKASGGHYEQLLCNGQPDETVNIRVRVQARQAFSYAYAYCKGWLPKGDVMAAELLAFIESKACHPSQAQGFTHLLGPDFKVIDERQDLYDHAFIFLAYAWVYKATRCTKTLKQATRLLEYCDLQFGSLIGGWMEGDYKAPHRRQNPHMHLFEAFMALYEASGDAQWLARASEIFTLFQTRFFDAEKGLLLEYFNSDWQPHYEAHGVCVEPGHMMEWVWLLRWYQKLTGRNVAQYTDILYDQAMRLGFTAGSCLMSDFVFVNEKLEVTERSATKRCWPLTEVIKAHIANARAGSAESEALAAGAIELLFRYFINTDVVGGYCDRRGANDEIVNDHISASTLYHLIVACGEVTDYCCERELAIKKLAC